MPHLVTQQGVNLAGVVGWEHRGRSRWAENGRDQELCRNSHVSKEVILSQRLAPVCIFFFPTYVPVCLCRSSDACSKTFSWLVTSPSWWKRGAKCADSTIRGCLRKNWHQMQTSMLQGEHGYHSSTGMLICLTCYLWLEHWHVWRGIAGHVVELCQWKCCGTG